MILLQHHPKVPAIVRRMVAVSGDLADFFAFILGQQVYHNTVHEQWEMDERIYHAPEKLDDSYEREFGGNAIERYRLTPERGEWVQRTDRCYAALSAPWKTGPRLFLREIPSERHLAVAWWDGSGHVNKAGIMIRRQEDSPSLTYLLGLLASRSVHRYYMWTSEKSRQDLFPRISLRSVRQLPIRIIDFEHPTEDGLKEEALVCCREAIEAGDYDTPFVLARAALAAHAAAHGPAGKPDLRDDEYWAEEIAWFEAEAGTVSVPPAGTEGGAGGRPPSDAADLREDFVHDLLASLAQRMIDLNAEKHEEKQGFLRWLERTLGCSIDDLSGKTLIRAYDERESIADFDDLCSRLCAAANRRKMSADPRGRDLQEQIEGEYAASVETLDELNASLAATDALIDRIVYALYGLGEEEIAIIEGEEAE